MRFARTVARWHLRVAVLATLVVSVVLASVGPAYAASATATFTYPLNSAQNVDVSKPFTWTSVAGSSAYYLYVGSTQGASDLVNSGEIGSTSWSVPALPTGATLYGRVWTKTSGTWSYSDITFTAAPGKATFTYPTGGAQNVDVSKPFRWTAVSGATSYYLYVGTTLGGKDLVSSGETQATSWSVPPLPVGSTLYGRIWTKLSTTWRYSDITFTAAPSPTRLTFPSDGATNVNTIKPFTWAAVPNAIAYYLYVGTTQGGTDLLSSGETTALSYGVGSLPLGPKVWARIWTKFANGWAYTDSSFVVAINASALTYPSANAQVSDASAAFTWSPSSGAIGYTLTIGTTQGSSELFTTNEVNNTTTSVTVPILPQGASLWARLWTRNPSGWASRDTPFTVAYSHAYFTYPTITTYVDTTTPFSWTATTGAQAYFLYVGTTPGGSDLVVSGETTSTSWTVPPLPVNTPLFARVWTKTSNGWLSSDVSFFAAFRFGYPTTGTVSADAATPFSWPSVTQAGSGPTTYRLTIGTNRDGVDLFDSGVITTTSVAVPPSVLPTGRTLYARVVAQLGDGTYRKAHSAFTVSGTRVTPSAMTYPLSGDTAVDASKPFQWTSNDVIQAYRLQVLNGTAVARDSGEVRVQRWFASDLPLGSYTAHLGTKVAGQWYWADTPFAVTANGGSADEEWASELWAADFTRQMADPDNSPYASSSLFSLTSGGQGRYAATCLDYTLTLLNAMKQMNVSGRHPANLQPKSVNISFMTNSYDTHTLAEVWRPQDQAWVVLDPTFDLAAKRSSDGRWATKEDVHGATVAKRWSDVTYQFLGAAGDRYARSYYLDYPLLYLNIPPLALGQGADPRAYMTSLPSLPSGRYGIYSIASTSSPVSLVIDGRTQMLDTSFINSLSKLFGATTVASPPGSTAEVTAYEANRYVF